jgi:hypothetical protein
VATITLVLWLLSLVLLGVAALAQRTDTAAGLALAGWLVVDLWLGLQFLVETSDPIRF